MIADRDDGVAARTRGAQPHEPGRDPFPRTPDGRSPDRRRSHADRPRRCGNPRPCGYRERRANRASRQWRRRCSRRHRRRRSRWPDRASEMVCNSLPSFVAAPGRASDGRASAAASPRLKYAFPSASTIAVEQYRLVAAVGRLPPAGGRPVHARLPRDSGGNREKRRRAPADRCRFHRCVRSILAGSSRRGVKIGKHLIGIGVFGFQQRADVGRQFGRGSRNASRQFSARIHA